MSRRPPAVPPDLPGFTPVRHLGSGGFADVYLYSEQLLGRQVAVKVLLSDKLGADAIDHFTNEANLMAQLSNHPSIVSVHTAGVSDDGRPYLVMEYCSRPNLQARYRAARFSQAEALRIGIQIAGAVETVHRAGVLHRDIKPANILVTDYGRPALTDFGIAATASSSTQTGMSVPWAPPEALAADGRSDERSDVYSLAATLYTLLAGRTPFELPGASNTSVDLMGRVQAMPLPPIGRPDVSPSFERALATAMAKDPAHRYASALEFARALQRVQIESGMQPTAVDVMEDAPEPAAFDPDDNATRIRSVSTIDAQGEGISRPTAPLPSPGADTIGAPPRPRFNPAPLAVPDAPPVDDTALRSPLVREPAPAREVARPRRWWPFAIPAGVAVLAVVWLVVSGLGATSLPGPGPTTAGPTVAPQDPVPTGAVPMVEELTGTVEKGRATFTWVNPEPLDGDVYLWRLDESGVEHDYAVVAEPKVVVDVVDSGRTCIEVVLRRANGRGAERPTVGCAP